MNVEFSKRPLWSIKFYLVVTVLYVLTTAIAVTVTEKNDLHLYLNQLHRTQVMDYFFTYWTELGAGVINAVICVLVSFLFPKSSRIAIILLGLMPLAFSGIFAGIFKQVFFAETMRPIGVFPEGSLELVEGVKLARMYSFPSGHTTAGFAFFAYLAYLFNKKIWLQILFGIAAILVGLSRVYLSFHFLEDTLAGAVLGIFCWVLGFWVVSGILMKIWPKLTL